MPKIIHKYKDWEPVQRDYIKDPKIANRIYEDGFMKIPFLDSEALSQLKNLYHENHQLEPKNGGMFYSVYSSNYKYREKIHDGIARVLHPQFEKHFHDYKNVINMFIVKSSGEKSEFYVHQDSTALDELKYSPLSIWIPLQDITQENGALNVIAKSHFFFSPYRGVTIKFGFHKIMDSIKSYLQPVFMKAGEALLFDPRLVHNSMENKSGNNRIAIVSGIFPENAAFESCYLDSESDQIDIYEHDDDYLLKYPNFMYDCHERPVSGKLTRKVPNDFPAMSESQFEELASLNELVKVNDRIELSAENCQMIAEPDGINRFPKTKKLKGKRRFFGLISS